MSKCILALLIITSLVVAYFVYKKRQKFKNTKPVYQEARESKDFNQPLYSYMKIPEGSTTNPPTSTVDENKQETVLNVGNVVAITLDKRQEAHVREDFLMGNESVEENETNRLGGYTTRVDVELVDIYGSVSVGETQATHDGGLFIEIEKYKEPFGKFKYTATVIGETTRTKRRVTQNSNLKAIDLSLINDSVSDYAMRIKSVIVKAVDDYYAKHENPKGVKAIYVVQTPNYRLRDIS